MKNTNHSLFDKYEMIKDLGTGSSGSVMLVRHISMDQERALKKVPKASAFAESALSEARLLKSLEHPSIPRIFDFEEDDAFYYIVEEYIDGETLDSFLLHQQLISPGLFFNICEQLCNVFIYLHTQISTPIIYRDLKPEHIIVFHNKLKLIDFGVSTYVTRKGNNFNHYGNIEFSAPECFTEDTITPVADIYSLGQLLQYILTFTPDSFSHKFQHIIQKATTSDASLRYMTVAELYQEIQEIQKLTGQAHLIHKIAVLGSHRGCGSTHVAVSLTCELNILGYHGIYIDSASAVSAAAVSESAEAALPDGVYTAEFDTDSGMFHANEACNGMGTLTVENGQMTFHVSLASKKIVNLYVGMAADAEANKADWLLPTTDTVTYSDGTSEEVYGYDIPVAAVDQDFQLALLGTKGKWYDHTVSIRNAQPKTEEAAEIPADGEYSVNVTLEGGSGRATVESPAALTVADGKMTAVILWSSPNYDYMIVDGEKYLPTNTEGNSTFEIPVSALGTPLAVTADTVAMSTPHEIEYTLTFALNG